MTSLGCARQEFSRQEAIPQRARISVVDGLEALLVSSPDTASDCFDGVSNSTSRGHDPGVFPPARRIFCIFWGRGTPLKRCKRCGAGLGRLGACCSVVPSRRSVARAGSRVCHGEVAYPEKRRHGWRAGLTLGPRVRIEGDLVRRTTCPAVSGTRIVRRARCGCRSPGRRPGRSRGARPSTASPGGIGRPHECLPVRGMLSCQRRRLACRAWRSGGWPMNSVFIRLTHQDTRAVPCSPRAMASWSTP